MRRRSSFRRTVVVLACTMAVPLAVVACKKPAPAVVDAGPPPAEVDAAPTVLTALDDDAGPDAADASDGAVAHHHVGGNANQARAKQCCNAIRAQAKQLGASPEANVLLGLAASCDQFAAQVGPTSGGQAPEMEPLRQMLKGRTMPAMCQGL